MVVMLSEAEVGCVTIMILLRVLVNTFTFAENYCGSEFGNLLKV